MFENIYGLSCVENQVLAILRDWGMDITPLYYDCAMPLKELFFYMVLKGDKQEYFDRVQRIQDVLKTMGIIRLERVRQEDMVRLRYAIRHCRERQRVLVRVNSSFTREILHARGLREDHFVQVRPDLNGFIVYNDLPETVAALSAKALSAVYDGEYFRLEWLRPLTDQDAEGLFAGRLFRPERQERFTFHQSDLEGLDRIGVRLRHMLGVYKLLRLRMAAYYGRKMDSSFIPVAEIANIQAKVEYLTLRREEDPAAFFPLLSELNQLDNDLMGFCKQQLTR